MACSEAPVGYSAPTASEHAGRVRPKALRSAKRCMTVIIILLVEDGGFEPPKSVTTDLQSAPFGRSGNPPRGAGDRNRTYNLLITSQLLYR